MLTVLVLLPLAALAAGYWSVRRPSSLRLVGALGVYLVALLLVWLSGHQAASFLVAFGAVLGMGWAAACPDPPEDEENPQGG